MDSNSPDPRRITREFMAALTIQPGTTAHGSGLADRLILPVLLGIGVAGAALQILQQDWLEFVLALVSVAAVFGLALTPQAQKRILGRQFNRRHALYVLMVWLYGSLWLNLLRLAITLPVEGKSSSGFYMLVLFLLALAIMWVRALLMMTRRYYPFFSSGIPIWEQILLALNEILASALAAIFLGSLLAQAVQPRVITLYREPLYTLALGSAVMLYYLTMQAMWIQRFNDALSQTHIWLRLARVFAPIGVVVSIVFIARRIVERADLRSTTLLNSAATNLAVLAIAPVFLQLIVVVTYLLLTSSQGIRQRFLPDLLLDRLSPRLAGTFRSISDMDLMLIIALVTLTIPTVVVIGGGNAITLLTRQIAQQGSVLVQTSEQALALIVSLPIYALILFVLILYCTVIARRSLSAEDRDELIARLPIGFLIILILTLYLFAVPVSQALIDGRLPRLPQDLGRILLFSILIPLVLLYSHYFLLVRLPYGRGQRLWRDAHGSALTRQLETVERRIDALNTEIDRLDLAWRDHRRESDPNSRFSTLYRYVQLNGMRDDLNMQRLRCISERQQLAEVSESPVSLTVARLPIRIVSLGIPLLLAIQIYQWAVLSNGLREIINNPNLTVVDFFREILSQLQF